MSERGNVSEHVVFSEPKASKEQRTYFSGVLRMFGNIFFAMLSVLVSLVLIAAITAPFSLLGKGETGVEQSVLFGESNAQTTFLSIPVQGVILGDGGSSPLDIFSGGATYGYQIKDRLREAAKDSNLAGVILEVDSPGGTIYGAQAIADGVAYYRKIAKKPVYAHVAGMAASGGYWAAISADKVLADFGASIGSIGVISGPFTYYNQPTATDGGLLGGGVVTQKGIEETYITAGVGKDMGNPFRRLTEDELRVLQAGVNNEYANFTKFVAARRGISEADVTSKVGAYLYDNKQAEDLKLIDGSMSRDDAYAALADAAKVKGDYRVVQELQPKQGLLSELLGSASLLKKNGTIVDQIAADRCAATKGIMVYFGEVAALCR